MTRLEFTHNIVSLLIAMEAEGESPIIDFVKRSDQEQQRLWKIGRDENGNKIGDTATNCDGIKIRSKHQSGCAMDIYFIENGKLSNPVKGFSYWHEVWIQMGGQLEISWDKNHWEG